MAAHALNPRRISIPAPPRGATRTARNGRFYPHISIPAPPRGATVPALAQLRRFLISIPAPPRGATIALKGVKRRKLFQFPPLREGRRQPPGFTRRFPYFNSRPSARGDVEANCKGDSTVISIPAPPRGATAAVDVVPLKPVISIPAPPRGATLRVFLCASGTRISIPAPPRGATPRSRRNAPQSFHFNSRPSARGD